MNVDNSNPIWEAHCITDKGEKIEWLGLRYRQAKWRYDRLRSAMLWRGMPLKACGYSLNKGESL